MDIKPQIFNATVMHKRLSPKVNTFTYGIYYLSLPLSRLKDQGTKDVIAINKAGLISFREKDHGQRDGSNLEEWIRNILKDHGVNSIIKTITLVTMPRVMGYGFNPVSFWIGCDEDKNIRVVLCEVNNTFGETHSYICIHSDHRPITQADWLVAEKVFHVSPFLVRGGCYRFRFSLQNDKLGIWIDYCDDEQNKQLITSLVGELVPLTRQNLRRSAWTYPLVTMRAIALIHWQALKLAWKGIRYNNKPEQKAERLTISEHVPTVMNKSQKH